MTQSPTAREKAAQVDAFRKWESTHNRDNYGRYDAWAAGIAWRDSHPAPAPQPSDEIRSRTIVTEFQTASKVELDSSTYGRLYHLVLDTLTEARKETREALREMRQESPQPSDDEFSRSFLEDQERVGSNLIDGLGVRLRLNARQSLIRQSSEKRGFEKGIEAAAKLRSQRDELLSVLKRVFTDLEMATPETRRAVSFNDIEAAIINASSEDEE
jgi:hypothetical protein